MTFGGAGAWSTDRKRAMERFILSMMAWIWMNMGLLLSSLTNGGTDDRDKVARD
jgi:hypothetical protein